MAHPGGGEVGSGIGMAALTFDEQVFLHGNTSIRIIYSRNIVQAVAVGADWLICRLSWEFFFKEFYGRAVEIGNVGVEHICGDTIFRHDR